MKRVALVYYSRSGNTKSLAQKVHVFLNERGFQADDCELVPERKLKMIPGIFKGAKGASVPLEKGFKFEKAAYDLVVVMGPVWASSNTPVINAFYENYCNEGSRYAIVTTSADLKASLNPINNQIDKIASFKANVAFSEAFKGPELKIEEKLNEAALKLVGKIEESISKME